MINTKLRVAFILWGEEGTALPQDKLLKRIRELLKHKSECDVLALWRAAYH